MMAQKAPYGLLGHFPLCGDCRPSRGRGYTNRA